MVQMNNPTFAKKCYFYVLLSNIRILFYSNFCQVTYSTASVTMWNNSGGERCDCLIPGFDVSVSTTWGLSIKVIIESQ